MFNPETYTHLFKENLQKNSEQLIQNIMEILEFNYFEGIALLDFSVFMQPFDLSIMLFSMDRDANEVFYEGEVGDVFRAVMNCLER